MGIGRLFGSDNAGLFIITLVQHAALAAACGYAVLVAKRWGMGVVYRLFAVLFWTLHPIIAFWPSTVIKDVLHYAVFLVFAVMILDFIRSPRYKLLVFLGAAGLVASLLRHPSMYICGASLVCLVFLRQSAIQRLLVCGTALVVIGGAALCSQSLIRATGAQPGSVREMLSLPFQQTARTMRNHPHAVTSQEWEAIDGVLDAANISELYFSGLSDYVKDTYKEDHTKLGEHFRTWLSMGLRHPFTYLEATLGNMYSYVCPNCDAPSMMVVFYMEKNEPHYSGFFDVEYTFSNENMRRGAYDWLMGLRSIPGFHLLFSVGNYTWLLLFLLLSLYRSKALNAHVLVAFVPAFMTILACMASPVNGHFRYYIPVIMMIPLLLAFVSLRVKESYGRYNQDIN